MTIPPNDPLKKYCIRLYEEDVKIVKKHFPNLGPGTGFNAICAGLLRKFVQGLRKKEGDGDDQR